MRQGGPGRTNNSGVQRQSPRFGAFTLQSFVSARLKFRPRQRLSHARQFAGVYQARISRTSGPLTVHAAISPEPFCRLGLSVGRRAGTAVQRAGFKRRIREAFRHIQHELPAGEGRGLDLIVAVRKHEPLEAEEYRRLLLALVLKVAADWERKGKA
jgi:ribonuclease P protein component